MINAVEGSNPSKAPTSQCLLQLLLADGRGDVLPEHWRFLSRRQLLRVHIEFQEQGEGAPLQRDRGVALDPLAGKLKEPVRRREQIGIAGRRTAW